MNGQKIRMPNKSVWSKLFTIQEPGMARSCTCSIITSVFGYC